MSKFKDLKLITIEFDSKLWDKHRSRKWLVNNDFTHLKNPTILDDKIIYTIEEHRKFNNCYKGKLSVIKGITFISIIL